ncbi:hypothetical protein PR048_032410 [Dryococelus australis]|uniref:ER membrane protein complex subunit 1 n=1 Tax=Dryococelus australis TaxID=614101 RepID=A0ABQ9G696_9NEOP|nr:hypothetical protein PR048_032410 [Dryococelus australis]
MQRPMASGFVGMFVHRIASQLFQLRSALLAVLGLGDSLSENQRAGLVRDEFGLHKIIVAATASGKVFGIDNLSGEILWHQWLEDGEPFTSGALNNPSMVLYVQRSNRHFPKPAQCVLVLRSKTTGKGMLFVFNPITGQAVEGGIVWLDYALKQTSLLHQPNKDALRGVLLLDTAGQLHVFPESARDVAIGIAPQTFLFTAEPEGTLSGYSLALSSTAHQMLCDMSLPVVAGVTGCDTGRRQIKVMVDRYSLSTTQTDTTELVATPVWTVKLVDKITAIVGKSPLERVHSQGRVLGDRSVLYKYINPNLVAVVTESTDPVHKCECVSLALQNFAQLFVVRDQAVFCSDGSRLEKLSRVELHKDGFVIRVEFIPSSHRATECASRDMVLLRNLAGMLPYLPVLRACKLPELQARPSATDDARSRNTDQFFDSHTNQDRMLTLPAARADNLQALPI